MVMFERIVLRVTAIEGDSRNFECLSRNCFGLNSELHNRVFWKTNEEKSLQTIHQMHQAP